MAVVAVVTIRVAVCVICVVCMIGVVGVVAWRRRTSRGSGRCALWWFSIHDCVDGSEEVRDAPISSGERVSFCCRGGKSDR